MVVKVAAARLGRPSYSDGLLRNPCAAAWPGKRILCLDMSTPIQAAKLHQHGRRAAMGMCGPIRAELAVNALRTHQHGPSTAGSIAA